MTPLETETETFSRRTRTITARFCDDGISYKSFEEAIRAYFEDVDTQSRVRRAREDSASLRDSIMGPAVWDDTHLWLRLSGHRSLTIALLGEIVTWATDESVPPISMRTMDRDVLLLDPGTDGDAWDGEPTLYDGRYHLPWDRHGLIEDRIGSTSLSISPGDAELWIYFSTNENNLPRDEPPPLRFSRVLVGEDRSPMLYWCESY